MWCSGPLWPLDRCMNYYYYYYNYYYYYYYHVVQRCRSAVPPVHILGKGNLFSSMRTENLRELVLNLALIIWDFPTFFFSFLWWDRQEVVCDTHHL